MSPPRARRTRPAIATLSLVALTLAALSGCASVSGDGAFAPIAQTASDRLHKDVAWARTDAERDAIAQRVAALLAKPLDADAAVQVALLNNRGLQATFDQLGISQAELVESGRLPNPGFSFGRLTQGSGVEVDRRIGFDLGRLLTLPVAHRIETQRFERTRLEVAQTMLALASQARKAYYDAVATQQTVGYMRQVRDAAEAGAELARRQAQAGNWNKLQQAREQSFYADAALGLARAERTSNAARERLTRLMALWGATTQFQLAERLPELPEAADELPQVEQIAMTRRLDVQAARLGTDALARNLGLTRATRVVNVLELGVVRNTYNDAPPQRGYEISLELPIFDWGTAKVARAEALYMQAVNQTAQTAIDARSEVREAYAGYRASYDIARHFRDEIVPLKKRISEENQLRYNGMLIGVFELLADARSQIASVNGAIEALHDFWIARADLDMALVGPPGMSPPPSSGASAAAGDATAH